MSDRKEAYYWVQFRGEEVIGWWSQKYKEFEIDGISRMCDECVVLDERPIIREEPKNDIKGE